MDLPAAIAEERLRIADWLDTLHANQWATQSCCGEWSVLQTAAHLLAGPVNGLRKSMPYMLKARGDIARANDLAAQDLAANGPDWVVAKLREVSGSRFRPPGYSFEAPLTDVTVHGQDMTRPFGVELGVPVERWDVALQTATATKYSPFSSRSKLKGLQFKATDTGFSHGSGQLVQGIARDLAHVMWGRTDALDSLTGDGVDLLRARMT